MSPMLFLTFLAMMGLANGRTLKTPVPPGFRLRVGSDGSDAAPDFMRMVTFLPTSINKYDSPTVETDTYATGEAVYFSPPSS